MRHTIVTLALALLERLFCRVNHGPLQPDALLWLEAYATRQLRRANSEGEELAILFKRLPDAGTWLAKRGLSPDQPVTAEHLQSAHDWLRDGSVRATGKSTIFCEKNP